jgi:2-desacetyl-2-hydroxyethyl bacteriochlorophyllide A dehydrogenase
MRNETVRGLWFVEPRRVTIRDVPLGEPRPEDAVVRTLYSGISPGTEMLAYRGEIDQRTALDDALPALHGSFSYPFRYGYSCVGEVERAGDGLPEGTTVFAYHPHQERFLVGAADAVPVDGVAPRHATLLPLVETALQVSLDAGPTPGALVVVQGLGVVGLLSALLLHRAGARVVASEPVAARRALAASLGLDAVEPADLAARITEQTDGAGAPLVVEVSGSPAALASALPLLAHEGTALVVSWYGTKAVPLPLGADFHRRRLTIRSSQVSTIPARLAAEWSRERRRRVARELLDELPLESLATHVFPFDAAADAYEEVDLRPDDLVHAALRYD